MIILASKSPRRRELIKLITNEYRVETANVDETLPQGITPAEAVMHLSGIKASAIHAGSDTVIGADTVVAVEGIILGKPKSTDNAREILTLLSGRWHSVFTGVTIIKEDRTKSFYEETRVKFLPLTEEDINRYVATGEPMDKAGAYGIQGYGSLLVEKIDGDYFNVVGLPVSRLNRELRIF